MADLKRRLMKMVMMVTESGCWIWTGIPNKEGYAKTIVKKKTKLVHRLMFELHNGPIPDGLTLDHGCRVRCCVNPYHLEPATHKENILSGMSPSAENARKTHCVNGHEVTQDNTYYFANRRTCRTCNLARCSRDYFSNHEKNREYNRRRAIEYRETHREFIRQQDRARYHAAKQRRPPET